MNEDIEALMGQALTENLGMLLDFDNDRFIIYAEVGVVELETDEGQPGKFVALTLTSAPLYDLHDEGQWEKSTYVFGASAALEIAAGQLQIALEYAVDPSPAKENQ
jgi:hypothetical protein